MSGIFGIGGGGDASFYPFLINQSLRYNDVDNVELFRTPSTNDRRKFTWSGWLKRSNIGRGQGIFGTTRGDATDFFIMQFTSADRIFIQDASTPSSSLVENIRLETSQVFRDVSAWYHIVLAVDTTQGTASDRVKLYVNGGQITDFSSGNNIQPTQNLDTQMNNSIVVAVGAYNTGSVDSLDGYLAEVNFVEGSQLAPTSFGETKNDVWIPKQYTGSYGTNGFRLEFAQSGLSNDANGVGADTSGNNNHLSVSNFSTTDQMPDSPTDNKATFNALLKDVKQATTLSDGNKTIEFAAGTDGFSGTPLTIFRNEGKAYCEVNLDTTYALNSTDSQCVFVVDHEQDMSAVGSGSVNNKLVGSYCGGGNGDAPAEISSNGVDQGGSPSKFRTTNDRVGVFIDFDAGKGFFSLNGTVQTVNGTPDVANGTNPHFTFTANSRLTVGVGGIHGNSSAPKLTLKDDPSDWGTTPPAGYTSFSTAKLQDPDIDPSKGEVPADYFNTVLYTGNAGSQSITGVGFQPDWLWFKSRSNADPHELIDSVRGVSKRLRLPSTAGESTASNDGFVSIDSDGFTLDGTGGGGQVNGNSRTYAAWNWKASGATVSNTDGTITSTVSASTESGFSIVSYTGTGSNATVGHGLNKKPQFIIIKNRDASRQWLIYNEVSEATKYMFFTTDAATPDNSSFNDTEPTSSVFSVGNSVSSNESSQKHIAYCFHSVTGYSNVGGYTGNGDADGQFVYTDFRPAWVMIKSASGGTGGWNIYDNKRQTFNPNQQILQAQSDAAENTSSGSSIAIDFLSNGFKSRSTHVNVDGRGYIYLAFAEQPFKYANAR